MNNIFKFISNLIKVNDFNGGQKYLKFSRHHRTLYNSDSENQINNAYKYTKTRGGF